MLKPLLSSKWIFNLTYRFVKFSLSSYDNLAAWKINNKKLKKSKSNLKCLPFYKRDKKNSLQYDPWENETVLEVCKRYSLLSHGIDKFWALRLRLYMMWWMETSGYFIQCQSYLAEYRDPLAILLAHTSPEISGKRKAIWGLCLGENISHLSAPRIPAARLSGIYLVVTIRGCIIAPATSEYINAFSCPLYARLRVYRC